MCAAKPITCKKLVQVFTKRQMKAISTCSGKIKFKNGKERSQKGGVSYDKCEQYKINIPLVYHKCISYTFIYSVS